MRLLVANPNTTPQVTELCANAARAVASPGTEIVPLTGRFGARIINSRAENAIAAHAMLDLLAENAKGADAVLLAVSYDTALLAAREVLDVPVVGMTEASMHAACLLGTRFGLVTFGTPFIYHELVAQQGLTGRLAGIRAITANAVDAYSNPAMVDQLVAEAATAVATEAGAEVVVLCGAAMAGMPARIAARVPVPVIDGIAAGVGMCEMLVRLKPAKARSGSLAHPGARPTIGLAAPLEALLKGG
ncbi:aspartate/glutamate racemase family protein [Falsiroseomonas oryzae]|uniref:aspartate/glutamate racemase family protein n=1 Tax=Falsiroseomonas oryzae TaxID=2766473 RepID=UPI0022EA4B38|nr:aspartate/glutamate racemase family protein [Roseomonas sp. MO-31]